MQYSLMTDNEIMLDLAQKIDALRIEKRLKDKEIEAASGISRQLLSDFRNGKRSISLTSFIRLLRGIGELERLAGLFDDKPLYSPLSVRDNEPSKRVRDKHSNKNDFTWEDEK